MILCKGINSFITQNEKNLKRNSPYVLGYLIEQNGKMEEVPEHMHHDVFLKDYYEKNYKGKNKTHPKNFADYLLYFLDIEDAAFYYGNSRNEDGSMSWIGRMYLPEREKISLVQRMIIEDLLRKIEEDSLKEYKISCWIPNYHYGEEAPINEVSDIEVSYDEYIAKKRIKQIS